jgi:integrase
VIGNVRVHELHRRDVTRVIDPIQRRGAVVEAGRVFEDVRGMLRWAVARGDLDHNPAEGMRKPAGRAPRERVLTNDEINILWHGLPEALARSKSVQRIIKLCLITAQRVSEISEMQRAELDLKAGLWLIPGSRTKNSHAHRVPLSSLAIGIIEEALADAGDTEFVFPAANGALSGHAVARTILRANETSEERPHGRFGIGPWSAHDLRRSAVSKMAELGVAPIVLGHVINHRSVTKAGVTLSVYSTYDYSPERRAALDLWADRLAAIIAGKPAEVVPIGRERNV